MLTCGKNGQKETISNVKFCPLVETEGEFGPHGVHHFSSPCTKTNQTENGELYK